MKIIGITGGVGAGKSEVLKLLRQNYNCEIVLADDVGNEVKEPGQDCYKEIVNIVGEQILDESGRIDKAKMAAAIFADDTLLGRVNACIHPAVIKRIKEKAENARKSEIYDYFFIEAALLIECGFNDYVDQMWYIYASKEVRRQRLKMTRGYADDKIDAIMSSQLSDEQFRAGADVIIDNSGELTDTFKQIQRALAK
ncbi:MAG: dephospho-CoA kinase [Lachnospiraceae bacterium]|nr:dephospho-CoA kinase [Candidatus Colinaster equi]